MKPEHLLDHYPKTVKCKGDVEVTIRPMAKGDFDLVRDFFSDFPREDRRYLRHDVTKSEIFADWFANLDYEKKLPLMALHEGKLVGHALLESGTTSWLSHVAEIRIVVSKEFRKNALGTILTRELFDQALARGHEKVVAELVAGQTGARKMLTRLGFAEEASLKDHVKDLDGKKHNLLIWSCSASDAWDKMEEMLQDFSPWTGWHH